MGVLRERTITQEQRNMSSQLAMRRLASLGHACRTYTHCSNRVFCHRRPVSVAAAHCLLQGKNFGVQTSSCYCKRVPSRFPQTFDLHKCYATSMASATDGQIKYLYDGGCKVCQTFKSSLEAQEGTKDRINYINIAEDSYSPAENNNVTYDEAMSTIHAITPGGETLKGPDAVRELFGEAGSTTAFLAEASKQPGFDQLFGSAYHFLSERRFEISDAAQKAQQTLGAQ